MTVTRLSELAITQLSNGLWLSFCALESALFKWQRGKFWLYQLSFKKKVFLPYPDLVNISHL